MNRLFTFCCICWYLGLPSLQAQHTDFTESVTFPVQKGMYILPLVLTDVDAVKSIHLSFEKAAYEELFYTMVKKEGTKISLPFYPDPHYDGDTYHSLIIVPAAVESVTLHFRPANLSSTHISYKVEVDEIVADHRTESLSLGYHRACECEAPLYINREGWGCPWGEDSLIFVPEYSPITHVVVHHQAGSAVAPYDATVRAIWDYHVNSNGWSDIGYHWLIAPDGKIYKGRAWLEGDENIRGAHMCSCNSNKMGICLLGDLTLASPSEAQYKSLYQLIGYKGCDLDIEPEIAGMVSTRVSGECADEWTPHVIGHKDGCPSGYTACPGDAFVPMMPQLVEDAQRYYVQCAGIVSSMNEVKKTKPTLFPNPSHGLLTIQHLDGPVVIRVYDVLGRVVASEISTQLTFSKELDVTPGQYVVLISGEKDYHTLLWNISMY